MYRFFIGLFIVLIFYSSSLVVSAVYVKTSGEAAQELAMFGVINTQSSQTWYRLNDTITRAEIAKITLNLHWISTPDHCSGDVFYDVDATLGDLCAYIEWLAKLWEISTDTHYYRPYDNVTRAEVTKIINWWDYWEAREDYYENWYTDVTPSLWDLYYEILHASPCLYTMDDTLHFLHPNYDALRGDVFYFSFCIGSNKWLLNNITTQRAEQSINYPLGFINLPDQAGTNLDLYGIVYYRNTKLETSTMQIEYSLSSNEFLYPQRFVLYLRGKSNFSEDVFRELLDKKLLSSAIKGTAVDTQDHFWMWSAYAITEGYTYDQESEIKDGSIGTLSAKYFSSEWRSWASEDIFFITAPLYENEYFSEVAIEIIDSWAYQSQDIENKLLDLLATLDLTLE